MQLCEKLSFESTVITNAPKYSKQSFEYNDVPKLEFGNETR